MGSSCKIPRKDRSDVVADPSVTATTNATTNVVLPKLSITMPSSNVVEISQTFYWPLYTKPIDWIYQQHVAETCSEEELEARARKIAIKLQELEFYKKTATATSTTSSSVAKDTSNDDDDDDDDDENNNLQEDEILMKRLIDDLVNEKEDWFSDLSGGQKSKVELVRKIFLHDTCPEVLFIDETMAPLDPASKKLVMMQLKQFCSESILIVIYHTDVGRTNSGGRELEEDEEGSDGTTAEECIPGNNFFDKNIHLEGGNIYIRDTC